MKNLKQRLINVLNYNGVDLTGVDLNETIRIYNHLIDFLTADVNMSYEDRFNFFIVGDNHFIKYFEIFKNLIEFQKKGLLMYLDYILLIDFIGYNRDSSPLQYFRSFQKKILEMYDEHGEDLLYKYYLVRENVIEDVIEFHSKYIINSKYIKNEYKDVFRKFSDLYSKYTKNIQLIYEHFNYNNHLCLDEYVNAVYYYFISKNILVNDCERACKFLDTIYNNIIGTIERLNMSGISNTKDLFYYIDCMYQNFDKKVKIMK